MNRTRHKKTLLEWVVGRKADSGLGLEYWNGQTWTASRLDAKGFLSPAEAETFAKQHGASFYKR